MAVEEGLINAALAVSLPTRPSDRLRFEEETDDTLEMTPEDDTEGKVQIGASFKYRIGLPTQFKSTYTTSYTTSVVSTKVSSYKLINGKGSGNGRNVMMFPAGFGAKLYTNLGSAKVVATNVPLTILREEVSFVNAVTGNLKYPVDDLIEWHWHGTPQGDDGPLSVSPVFDRETVTLPLADDQKCVCGVLRVSYVTYFDRVQVTCRYKSTVLLVGKKVVNGEDIVADLSIDFGEGDDAPGETTTCSTSTTLPGTTYKDVVFTVKDYCTDLEVPNATVMIKGPTGEHHGITNQVGQITFAALMVGGTYSVQMSKSGYTDSDKDALNNESFTVQ